MSIAGKILRGQRRWAVAVAACVAALASLIEPLAAAGCTHQQLADAVDAAGEQLRQLTAATQPVLQAKLLRLKAVKGWGDAEFEDKGYAALEDERTAKLDANANELLARIDQLGGDDATAPEPECSRVAETESVSLELQATIKTKSQYVLKRLDELIAEGGGPVGESNGRIAAAASAPAMPPTAAAQPTPAANPAPGTVAAKPAAPKPDKRWSTQTKAVPADPVAAVKVPEALATVPPPPPATTPPPASEGYTIDEIVDAARGPFGKASANLARVLEHAFAQSGRPTGYILGQETGGAFVAGLRYGKGTLYLRSGATLPVYWHGPSIGADVGAQGAATLFLIYKIKEPGELFSSFTGIEGSAFVVGGLGLTLMSNGSVGMAPIRSGIGLRLGANLGYMRFTSKPTWNPF